MGFIPKNRITTVCMVLAALAFVNTPLLVQATQITPNPNPGGSTIDIINDPFAFNSDNSYTNLGTVNIQTGSTLTNNPGATLANGDLGCCSPHSEATINISSGATLINNGTLTNYSAVSGAITNSGTLINTGTLNNTGPPVTLLNASGGVLINSGTYWGFGGMHNAGTLINTATFQNVEDSVSNSGRWINTGSVSFSAGSALANQAGGTLINSGTWEFLTQGIINTGTVTNTSTGVLTLAYVRNQAGGTVFNAGTLNSSAGVTNEAGATLVNTGTVALTPGLFGPVTITNSGTLTNLGSIVGTGTYTQTAGQTMNNGSLSQLGGVNIQGGNLSGTGTITGPVTIASGATVSPGNSPGTLTINGNVSSSGNMLFQIGGPISGQYDVLKINGNAVFTGGNITFDFINGFVASARDSWDFLYASAITGWDTLTFTVNGLRSNQTYAFSYANGVETLTVREVHNVPESDSFLFLAIGLVALGWWRRKQLAH